MKKIFIPILVLCLMASVMDAQDSTGKFSISIRFSPTSSFKINFMGMSDYVAGGGDKVGADLNIGSFSADVIGRYRVSDQLSARVGIGIGSLQLKSYNVYSYSNGDTDVLEGHLKQTRVNIMPGVERHFIHKKLELLTGLGLPIGMIGKTTAAVRTTYTDAFGVDMYEETFEVPGGFGIGLQSFAGFNFYITNKLALGTEISYGVGYVNMGGRTIITSNSNGSLDTYAGDELKVNGFSMFPLNGALILTMNL